MRFAEHQLPTYQGAQQIAPATTRTTWRGIRLTIRASIDPLPARLLRAALMLPQPASTSPQSLIP